MASIFADSMVRFKQDGYKPTRGIKLALTCGEETPERSTASATSSNITER